jgi:alpha-L-fucosidase
MVGVSPTSTGKFPEETIKRLKWVGKWLKVNGEAIYNTRPWKRWAQGDYIRFSQSKDRKYVYVIVSKWPGDEIKIDKLLANKNSKIIMLGYNDSSGAKSLTWSQEKDSLRILIPDSLQAIEKRPCEFAWVFKIEQQ